MWPAQKKEVTSLSTEQFQAREAQSADEIAVRTLYRKMIEGWNRRSAEVFAAVFAEDGELIGFDGSQMNGREEIAATLQQIFTDHVTAPYISKVKEVRFLSPDVAMLHAIVGMVPPGQADLNPAVNAHQTLVAIRRAGQWHIVHFQNTPAQFHGRPELVEQMTRELRQLVE